MDISKTSSHDKRNRSTGRHRLADVASLAGVSLMTASRALRDTGQVSPELVERVRHAAAQLQYVPNPAAQALATSRSSSVAVLIPALTNAVFADLLEAAHKVLFPEGLQVLIGNTHYEPEQEEELLRNFLSYRPAGLLISGFDHTPETRGLIETSGVPCVHMMEIVDDAALYCVGFSQPDAARCVVDYLLGRGHRRIGFIGASMDPRARQRHAAYRATLAAHGLQDDTLESFVADPTSVGLGARLFQELVARRPDIEAIFFSNDDLAQGAMFEALRLGIRIPDDVAIVGFNDVEQSAISYPRMTTIRTPRSEIGTQAAQMLLDLVRGKPVRRRAVDVGFELIVRESA